MQIIRVYRFPSFPNFGLGSPVLQTKHETLAWSARPCHVFFRVKCQAYKNAWESAGVSRLLRGGQRRSSRTCPAGDFVVRRGSLDMS